MSVGRKVLPLALAGLVLGGCANSQQSPQTQSFGFATNGESAPPPAFRPASAPAPNAYAPRVDIPVGAPIVEFRSRTGPDIIGHTYLVFGYQGENGTIVEPDQIGLYPKDLSGFAVGMGGMAEATTEPVSLDISIPPSNVYRHQLTEDEYARLSAAAAAARANPPKWNWTRYNCNTFVADMAETAGMQTPAGGTLLAPVLFVEKLKSLNT